MIHHGDLFDVLPMLDAESIDACVTDPPYGIGFMGREWDTFGGEKEYKARSEQGYQHAGVLPGYGRGGKTEDRTRFIQKSNIEFQHWSEQWAREVFRVLKPGAYLVVCGAPRSYHRMACGLEDAGFVIRDKFAWLFGSGFPKNYNLGDGKGTALKPAHEPIALAWKPFKGTIKACHEQHGTAGLNIEACRVGDDDTRRLKDGGRGQFPHEDDAWTPKTVTVGSELGRWPANVVIDEVAAAAIDEQSGFLHSAGFVAPSAIPAGKYSEGRIAYGSGISDGRTPFDYKDGGGGASRFYYVAKPSREERDFGTAHMTARQRDESRKDGNPGGDNPRNRGLQPRGNFHPTVKPVELMRWLVRLVTPIDGVVLDPFLGSGTTAMAARYEHRRYIGIEREADYIRIAEARIAAVAPLFGSEAST